MQKDYANNNMKKKQQLKNRMIMCLSGMDRKI